VYATIDNAEAHARIVETLMPFNEPWAKHAPVLILVVAKLYEAPGKEFVSYYDTGMAVSNLIAQATAEGLATHQMGGFDAEKARELLGIPEGYNPLAMIALGHHGGDERLSDYNREREYAPRTRKIQSEFVHQGKW
jgi:nitroreductase